MYAIRSYYVESRPGREAVGCARRGGRLDPGDPRTSGREGLAVDVLTIEIVGKFGQLGVGRGLVESRRLLREGRRHQPQKEKRGDAHGLLATQKQSQDVPEHHRNRGKQRHRRRNIFVLWIVVNDIRRVIEA